MMKGRWTSGCRTTEPNISTIESQPEVWIHQNDPSLSGGGSRINGSQPGNPIKLKQWPIEYQQQQLQPPPSTPRRSSLDSNHSAAARVIPLSRWPLSDPRGGRRTTFNSLCTGFNARRSAIDNRYVPDPCKSGQSSDENCTGDRNRNSTGVRALKTNLFSQEDMNWSQEDNLCFLTDTSREYVNTNMHSLATDSSMGSQSLSKDIDTFGVTQYPLKDMDSSKANQCPLNVMDLSKAHQCSLKDNDLKDEQVSLRDKVRTSKADEQKLCLQGKRGGEKCARLMSRLCHLKRSKHDNAV